MRLQIPHINGHCQADLNRFTSKGGSLLVYSTSHFMSKSLLASYLHSKNDTNPKSPYQQPSNSYTRQRQFSRGNACTNANGYGKYSAVGGTKSLNYLFLSCSSPWISMSFKFSSSTASRSPAYSKRALGDMVSRKKWGTDQGKEGE